MNDDDDDFFHLTQSTGDSGATSPNLQGLGLIGVGMPPETTQRRILFFKTNEK